MHAGAGRSQAARPRLELVALGLILGLAVPLSSLASRQGAAPFALTGWVSATSALFCLALALGRGSLFVPRAGEALFFLAWAMIGTVLPQALLFWAAARLASNTISAVVLLEGFIVFAAAAAMRLETPSLRRLAGLAIGCAGIVPLLSGARYAPDADQILTLAAALCLPACYAGENLLLATAMPRRLDPIAGLALMQAIGAVIAFALAATVGEVVRPDPGAGSLSLLVLALGLCTATANYLFQRLIATAGPVFTGQCSCLITLAGTGWSLVLLGETVSLWSAASLAAVILGVRLVAPCAPAAGVEPA